jgi:hypothetical protein
MMTIICLLPILIPAVLVLTHRAMVAAFGPVDGDE